MAEEILLTDASRTGWTAGVAEPFGKSLPESCLLADVLRIRELHGLAGYQAVIAGSATQGGACLPDALGLCAIIGQIWRASPLPRSSSA